MDVSFIIVNYNTTALTEQCIESIKKYTKKQTYEIIVVDNASPDRSITNLNKNYPEVKLILHTENIGFGRANNLAIDIATGRYFFLINSDTYLLNDAAAVFWNYMEASKHADVGCCGGALFYPNGKNQMCYGNFPSILEAVSLLGFYILYKDYFNKYICSGVINYSSENRVVDYITGADMFIRRSALEKTGGFDPEFFMYFEETELSFRLKKAGYRSALVPEAQIVHLEGASQDKGAYFNFKKISMYERSKNLFFKKCHGKFYAGAVKAVSVFRNLVLLVLKGNSGYLKKAKIIVLA